MRYLPTICLVLTTTLSLSDRASAQELEPYAYAHNPTGVNFIITAYGENWGDLLFDPTVPITDARAGWHNLMLGYGRTFEVFGHSANLAVVVPYVWGDASGRVEGEFGEVFRSGFADPRLRLSVNLLGGPALAPAEFERFEPRTTLGATLFFVPPMGHYLPDKLVNIGSNRWSVKGELGLSHPVGNWRFELAAGAWFFSDNNDFFGGVEREQEPVTAVQGHIIYSFRRQLWLALDANHYRGGKTSIDGTLNADLQANTRVGLTLSMPLIAKQSLKIAYSRGAATRIGGDFQQVTVGWQYTWF